MASGKKKGQVKKSSYAGLQEHVRSIELPRIEVVENKYRDKHYICEHVFPEFTTLCPKTKLPDFATIRIVYEPDNYLVELKSLKYYFIAYRNLGFFHEHFTNRILEDFVKHVMPRWAYVEAKVNIRGGIASTIRVLWKAKKLSRESRELVENFLKSNRD